MHFGLPAWVEQVRVRVDWYERGEARSGTAQGVDPDGFRGAVLELRLGVR